MVFVGFLFLLFFYLKNLEISLNATFGNASNILCTKSPRSRNTTVLERHLAVRKCLTCLPSKGHEKLKSKV